MSSIRARLLIALLIMVALISLLAAGVTYRRVLNETSTLFDYQLRQMALSLRSQISLAPRIEVPPDQGDADFVVQIWDVFGARTYLSRPGLPLINQTVLGYADLSLRGQAWRAYGLQMGTLAPLGTKNLPLEIEPLVSELNRLLDRLQRAFSTQRAFISDAAHELRSPLTALRLQLQLLDRAPDEAARLEARGRLGAAVERAIHLVEQLLALARSEPQETAADFQLADLSVAAAQGIQDAHDLAVARSIDLGLDAAAQLRIRGDPEELRTLARNLVDNAVRYTPPNGSVQVRTRSTAKDAVLEVTDNGPGIAPADRERVFDRFYRRAAAQESGTGLGLAIVKAIAERHGAAVLLAEAPGGGLHVTVNFPKAS
jgi:signal transduction histidine kinase